MNTFKEELKKGVLINSLGIMGKISGPTLLIVVNQLYGTDVFGIYLTANMLIEIIISLLTNGFKDGALIYVSKHSDNENEKPLLYQALTNAFSWSIGLGIVFWIFFQFLADNILLAFYESAYASRLIPVVQLMALSMPLMAFDRLVIAATQGLKIMKYEALINGGLRPFFLLIGATCFYFYDQTAVGIGLGYVITQIFVGLYTIFIFNKYFSFTLLWKAFLTFSLHSELIRFSIPQSLNTTLNRFITGMDVLMLPALGASPLQVGIYGTGTSIIREIRQIKLAFSAPFNPHVVKFIRDKDFSGLSDAYTLTTRYITLATIPIIVIIATTSHLIINLISSVPVDDSLFMLFLLPVPYFYNSFSLAGNIVVMAGKSSLVLLNSSLVALLNLILNLILIPQFGLIGAATASSIAVGIVSFMEVLEARKFVGAKLLFSKLFWIHFLGILGLVAGIVLHIKLYLH